MFLLMFVFCLYKPLNFIKWAHLLSPTLYQTNESPISIQSKTTICNSTSVCAYQVSQFTETLADNVEDAQQQLDIVQVHFTSTGTWSIRTHNFQQLLCKIYHTICWSVNSIHNFINKLLASSFPIKPTCRNAIKFRITEQLTCRLCMSAMLTSNHKKHIAAR